MALRRSYCTSRLTRPPTQRRRYDAKRTRRRRPATSSAEPGRDRTGLVHDAVVDDDLLETTGVSGRDGLTDDGGAEGDGDVAAVREEERRQPPDPAAASRRERLGVSRSSGGRLALKRAPPVRRPGRPRGRRCRRALAVRDASSMWASNARHVRPARHGRSRARRVLRASSSSWTPRRSPSTSERRTQPRATMPSSKPLSVGRLMAALAAMRPARSGDEAMSGERRGTGGGSCRSRDRSRRRAATASVRAASCREKRVPRVETGRSGATSLGYRTTSAEPTART